MIISIPESDKKIAHFSNIIDVHANQSEILNLIEDFDPMYAGGYPMALLFAPRTTNNKYIKSGYYTDYDLYFSDDSQLQAAISVLTERAVATAASVYETDNAVTYKFPLQEEKFLQMQVVKMRCGSPQEILNTFDFKNCAVGYSPLTKTMHFHQEAPKLHLDKELDILDPWMINDIGNIIEANAIIQLMRFKKYCLRWGYSLSRDAFEKLYSLYVQKPDIKIQANQTYLVHDGPYDRETFIGLANQNVWSAMAPILRDNIYWSESLDVHKLIQNSNELIYQTPIASENEGNPGEEIPF